MGTVLEVWIFAFSTFAFLSPIIFHESVGFILTITQNGQSLNTSGPSLTPIGQKQCVRECLRRGDCLSVNYWRSQLRCQLNPAVVGPGLALVPDSSGVYMEKDSQPQDLLPGSCASSACTHKCTDLSSGMTACMSIFREATETSPSPTTTTTVPTLPPIITTTTTAPPTTSSLTTTSATTTTTTTTSPSPTTTTTVPTLPPIITTTTTAPPTTSSLTTTSATTTTTTTTSPSPTTTTTVPTLPQIITTTTTAPPTTTSSSTTTSATTTTTTSPSPTTTTTLPTLPQIITTTTTTAPPPTTSSSTTTSATTTTTTTSPSPTTTTTVPTLPQIITTTTTTAPSTTTSSSTTTSAATTTTTTSPSPTTTTTVPTLPQIITTTTAPPTTTSSSTTTSVTTTTTTTTLPSTTSSTTTTTTSPTTTTTLSLQTTTAGPVLACPPTFVWNPVVSLCYKVHELPLMWPDAKVHCESLGGRLAVLDTAAKLDVLTSDYSAGVLMNFRYFIGGSYDDVIMDWTWVDGLIIDPIFLMSYVISGGSGYCLAWDDTTVLTQLLCPLSQPFVCEIPTAAMPPSVPPPTIPTTMPSNPPTPSTMAPPLTSSPVPVLTPVCPDSFVYNPSLNFCYRVDETAFAWENAKTHCESSGARLAILDTPDKLSAIFSDYTAGLLMSLNYFIGAQYDDLALEYKWVNNSLVDNGFIMNYPVTRTTGQCLLWNDLDMLRSLPCNYSLPVICEVPMVTVTPTEAPFSCPSTYIWKPAVSLCYKNIEDTHKWSEGDVTCTTAGGRLAILNTQEKLMSVMDDYNLGGLLFSNAYHIGGQFVAGVGWRWVDNTPVDPSLLNSYSILAVDGDCLFWDSLYLLIQDKCDTSERILCEQVPPVI